MFKTQRERTLAILLGTAFGVFLLWETVGQILIQPMTDLESQIAAARSGNDTLQEQSSTIDRAVRHLKTAAATSLPADPGKAAVMYQGWLIQLMDRCAVANAIVTPAPAIAETSVGHRIPFTVQAEASTTQIAQLLDMFSTAAILHRVTSLNIANQSEGAGLHRITLSIEALALANASDINSLPDPQQPDSADSLTAILSSGDIFRRQLPVQVAVEPPPAEYTPPAPADTKPEPPKADPLKSVRFVASVWNGQQRVAWFVDQRSKEERTVVANAELVLPELTGKVLSIDNDRLLMEMSGQKFSLQLGQTLSQRETLQ